MDRPDDFLASNVTVEAEHPRVMKFVAKQSSAGAALRRRVVELYQAVRDEIFYDPYRIDLSVEGLRASTTLENRFGWCVPKAALLAACCRAIGVPAALGFADVRNHLTTARLRERMQSDVFYWHGYTSIFLEGQWVKATPAFNASLCVKLNLTPLEFDGRSDSIYHPFDQEGRQHMEYIHDRGTYASIPIEKIRGTFESAYPNFGRVLSDANFETDIECAADSGSKE